MLLSHRRMYSAFAQAAFSTQNSLPAFLIGKILIIFEDSVQMDREKKRIMDLVKKSFFLL